MPRGAHFKKMWQDDPEGMYEKTQERLKNARLARQKQIEVMTADKQARLQRLFKWCDEQDKIYAERKARGDFKPRRVPLFGGDRIESSKREGKAAEQTSPKRRLVVRGR